MISVFSSVLDSWGGFGGGDHPKRPFWGRQLPILAVLGSLVLAVPVIAQTGNTTIQPDCLIPFSFTVAGNFPASAVANGPGDNRTKGCAAWTLMYQSTGMTGVSVTLQSGSSVSTTVSFGSFAGTISMGYVNPIVSDTGGSLQATNGTADISWVRVNVAATGTGTLTGVLYGFRNSSAAVNAGVGSVTSLSQACGITATPDPITSTGTILSNGVCVTIDNAASTGTTVNHLAKLTGAPSTAVISSAGDTSGAIGIVDSGAGTTGSAIIQTQGEHTCVFDGSTTAGHYVAISATTDGDCTDAGASFPTTGQVIGVVLSTNSGAGIYFVDMSLRQSSASGGGSGGSSYSQSFTSQTSVVLTHNLGSTAVITQCFDNGSPAQNIEWNTEQITDANNVTVTFTNAQSGLCVVTSGGGTQGPAGPPGAPGVSPGSLSNQPLTGLGVEYVSGLTFTVGAGTYLIGGTQYSSPLTSVTLAAADPSNPRIDVIYVDDNSSVQVLTGTPAATPAQPTVDYSTELPLNLVQVPAGSTTPGGISSTLLYDENVEWTCASTAHINCASTSNPFRGTKDIEATSAVLGNNFTLVKPASGTTDLSTLNTLIFYIRSKAKWPTGNGSGSNGLRTLSLFWLNGSTQVGLQVVLRDNAFGFSSSNTTGYQQITIPLGLFATGSNLVTTLKAQVTGNGGSSSFGWYIDAVSIQSGNGTLTLPATVMNFKGTWNSTANYNVNDTVVSGGLGYVALAANTNVALTTAGTWATLGSTRTIASGAKALATSAISSASCTAAQTATATGTLTSDAIIASFAGDPTAVTGYVPLTTGMLTIVVYPTVDTVNFKVCNNTLSSITPGAITLNWRVVR